MDTQLNCDFLFCYRFFIIRVFYVLLSCHFVNVREQSSSNNTNYKDCIMN